MFTNGLKKKVSFYKAPNHSIECVPSSHLHIICMSIITRKIKKIVKSWIQFQLLCSQEKLYHSIPIERNVHLKPILLCEKKTKKKEKKLETVDSSFESLRCVRAEPV